jgi:tRNA-Thr(GGU) m(6)t(6)A37 methyltransferase TsaA
MMQGLQNRDLSMDQPGKDRSRVPEKPYTVKPIGFIHSELVNLEDAPRQGDEGAPAAWLDILPTMSEGLGSIHVGDELIVLTWLHRSSRDTLQVHPRGDRQAPLAGVFATRSPDRPNPIGMHQVTVLEIAGQVLKVTPLEAIHGTPIVDIKPVWPQQQKIRS